MILAAWWQAGWPQAAGRRGRQYRYTGTQPPDWVLRRHQRGRATSCPETWRAPQKVLRCGTVATCGLSDGGRGGFQPPHAGVSVWVRDLLVIAALNISLPTGGFQRTTAGISTTALSWVDPPRPYLLGAAASVRGSAARRRTMVALFRV